MDPKVSDQPPGPEADWDTAFAAANKMAEALSRSVEALKLVASAVTGYRAHLIEMGWPVPLADQLAGQVLAQFQNQLLFGRAR